MRAILLMALLAIVGAIDVGCYGPHLCNYIDGDYECGPSPDAYQRRSAIDHQRVIELETGRYRY